VNAPVNAPVLAPALTKPLRLLLLVMLLSSPSWTWADEMLMGRVPFKAEVVMEYVKTSITEHGYAIAHLQLCDTGLGDFGYKTDFYQTVFFGKVEEARLIGRDYPELAPYIPLKIAVIAEKGETLLVALNPEALAPFYDDERIQIQLGRWNSDIVSIFEDVRRDIEARAAGS
jgi:uncharacterized protein (DUF302 family)